MRFVVTGASGHLGANVIRALVAAGEPVRAVDIRPSAALPNNAAEFVRGDVLDPVTLKDAFAGTEFVLHLAAKISIAGDRDGSVRRVNVDGVRHVADAALEAGVRRVVRCSSLHAYDVGATHGAVRENASRSTDERLPAGTVPRSPSSDGWWRRSPVVARHVWWCRWRRSASPLKPPCASLARRRAGRLLLTPESLHALATDPAVDYSKAVAELGYRARRLAETVADLHASFIADGRL